MVEDEGKRQGERTYFIYFFIISLLIATIHFLSAFGIISRTSFWALSVNAYFPKSFLVVQLILVTACLVSFFLPHLIKMLTKIPTRVQYILFAICFVVMAVVLREAVPLYGDGYLYQKDITAKMLKFAEVLSSLIYRAIYLILPQDVSSGAVVYKIVNTICSIPMVFIIVQMARRVRKGYTPFFLIMLLSLGANVLFFGHVENYTLCYVVMLFYLYYITRAKPNVWILSFVLGISVSLHVVALCLVPSLIYMVFKHRKELSKVKTVLCMIAFFAMPLVATVFFGFAIGLTPNKFFGDIFGSLTPLKGYAHTEYFSSIFTISHWLDIINLFFLSLPTWPIVLLLLFGFKKCRNMSKEVNYRLLFFIGIPFVLFIIFFDSPLGLARDWDLGVTAMLWLVLAITVCAVYVISKVYLSPSFLMSISLLTLVLSVPWFAIQRFSKYSVERYHDLLDARPDLPGIAYGYEILGRYYHDQNDYHKSLKAYEKASHFDPENYRHYHSIAMEYYNIKDFSGTTANLRKAYDLSPQKMDILIALAQIYHIAGHDDSALSTFQEVYRVDTLNIDYQYSLACAYYWTGSYYKSREMFQRMLMSHPDHYHAMLGLVDVAVTIGDLNSAVVLLNRIESAHGPDETIKARRSNLQRIMSEKSVRGTLFK